MSCERDPLVDEGIEAKNFVLPENVLPEYERNIDHKRFITSPDDEVLELGRKIYSDICFACHGTVGQPGFIPQATTFWSGEFLVGTDPYSMYQTITRGFGKMVPQVNLVPAEKYAVIHFIRETFVKELNPDQYFQVDSAYLVQLPEGNIPGPSPRVRRPWAEMDYGQFLMHTYELADSFTAPREISGGPSPLPYENLVTANFAYKGIAVRVDDGPGGVAAGGAWVLFDHDLLRVAGAWTGEGFIDYESILMNERHNIYPRTVGHIHFANPSVPGWANPSDGSFQDPRFRAVDNRKFGPLPRSWAHYKGLYRYEDQVIIEYTVGKANVLEHFDLAWDSDTPVFIRNIQISPAPSPLMLRLVPEDVEIIVRGSVNEPVVKDGFKVLEIPSNQAVRLQILIGQNENQITGTSRFDNWPMEDLSKFTQGSPAQYTDVISTPIVRGKAEEAFVADVLSLPFMNPWKARVRPSGIDFVEGTDIAYVCTIDGDVWKVDNINSLSGNLNWRRIASGLFQPLGILYHKGEIYVGCRDQIVILKDLNGDGETDYYKSFNSDHQVTEHFHEFAMGLQKDQDGNFYYTRSARHARRELIPQHGTLLRVSPDGTKTTILANGFRAANGVCLNPDGSFFVTDQEGYWNPMNRINLVNEGGFYGNMYGYGAPTDSSDAAMEQPLCWVDMKYDRSPSELVWADTDEWGPLNNQLLSLSYGYGRIFMVLPQQVRDTYQAGIVKIPLPDLPTGLIRGRFHPADGQLYVCGMTAWATSQVLQPGGLYRIRHTEKLLRLPVALSVTPNGIRLKFSCKLNRTEEANIQNYKVNSWQLERTRRYGSPRIDPKEWKIESINVISANEVELIIPEIKPSWVVEILYNLMDRKGVEFEGAIQSTIYTVPENDDHDQNKLFQ